MFLDLKILVILHLKKKTIEGCKKERLQIRRNREIIVENFGKEITP